jgi:hypothetical protein
MRRSLPTRPFRSRRAAPLVVDLRVMAADLEAAEQFLAANARVLERRRFDRMFRGGPAGPVRDAVAAFRNDDGGFGHALEPDGRGPESQPAAVLTALQVMHESDAWDDELARGACDFLATTEPEGGGAPFVLPGVERWPHGPWWLPQEGLPASLITTGQSLGPLLARGVEHPWVERAEAWLWSRVDDPGETGPYDVHGLVAFLDGVPDRERAEAGAERLADVVRRATDPPKPGGPPDVHRAIEYARTPESVARVVFDDAQIEADLDRLESDQRDDGGWMFTWLAWSPVAEAEWRGVVTIEAVRTLRAYGRL